MSPLDVNKKLYAFTDATVTQGVCNILLQRKDEGDPSKDYHIISCDSTTIKRGWVKYAPFEAETTAIVFLCTKEEFYLRGAKVLHIYSDTKNMNKFLPPDIISVKNEPQIVLHEGKVVAVQPPGRVRPREGDVAR